MSTDNHDVPMQLDPVSIQADAHLQVDVDSDDYSDFGDDPEALAIIDQLLQAATQRKENQYAPLEVTDIEDYEGPRGVRLPKLPVRETARQTDDHNLLSQVQAGQTVRDEGAERRQSSGNEADVTLRETKSPTPEQPTVPDTRSPLERFRKPPKKALSVTDLISPSWCQLQYYYVLTKHGRKRRTPAMKQGSAVHQALEDEVHTTVSVEITKKEDSWGLRIWNIIQGLRTLRETGMTREMEVWGSVGGELVNGIIDELSYECPDPKLEASTQDLQEKKDAEPVLPEYQASIRDYLVTNETRLETQSLTEALRDGTDILEATSSTSHSAKASSHVDARKIYLTDVKTRQTPTLPTGSATTTTYLQLHIYHHMLENLAQDKFSLSQLADRYNFDVDETFSDSFIAQIGGLNQEVFALSQQSDEMGHELLPSTQDSMDVLLQHNTVARLWEFMLEQLRLTFLLPSITSGDNTQNVDEPPPSSLSQLPRLPSQPTRLSPILTARYISTNYKHLASTENSKPRILGSRSILFSPAFLTSSLYESLGFWKGEREPKGVEVNDAWKCRVCEFRDDCVWVKERDENMVREARERRRLKDALGEADGVEKGRRSRV